METLTSRYDDELFQEHKDEADAAELRKVVFNTILSRTVKTLNPGAHLSESDTSAGSGSDSELSAEEPGKQMNRTRAERVDGRCYYSDRNYSGSDEEFSYSGSVSDDEDISYSGSLSDDTDEDDDEDSYSGRDYESDYLFASRELDDDEENSYSGRDYESDYLFASRELDDEDEDSNSEKNKNSTYSGRAYATVEDEIEKDLREADVKPRNEIAEQGLETSEYPAWEDIQKGEPLSNVLSDRLEEVDNPTYRGRLFYESYLDDEPNYNEMLANGAAEGDLKKVKTAIQHGATSYQYALNLASQNKHKRVVDYLEKKTKGKDENKNKSKNKTKGYGGRLFYELDDEPNYNEMLANGAAEGDLKKVKTAIQHGATSYQYALNLASQNKHKRVADYLKKKAKGKDENKNENKNKNKKKSYDGRKTELIFEDEVEPDEKLINGAANGDLKKVKEALAEGATNYKAAIYWAKHKHHSTIAKYLESSKRKSTELSGRRY